LLFRTAADKIFIIPKKNDYAAECFGIIKRGQAKRFFGLLPIFAIPFIVLMLWITGLVGISQAYAETPAAYKGLNTELPAAAPARDSSWNKLNYYEQADRDSAKIRTLMKQDPFFKDKLAVAALDPLLSNPVSGAYPSGLKQVKDPNEEKVYRKLKSLNQALEKSPAMKNSAQTPERKDSAIHVQAQEINRLESMMQQMNEPRSGNSEIDQLKGLLDKIENIQHPGKVEEELRERSEKNRGRIFAISLPAGDNISLLSDAEPALQQADADSLVSEFSQVGQNRFYSLDEPGQGPVKTAASIRATIPEDERLVSGETLRLRTGQDIYVNGVLIPAGSFISGKGELRANRLTVNILSIAQGDYILPVSMNVYGTDGIEGIPIQDALTRDVAANSGSQTIDNIGLATLDQSFGAQAAGAGLQAAKSLINHKAKLVRVTLRAGTEVLLVDKQQLK
jgi:conjugative transposon TraM protein